MEMFISFEGIDGCGKSTQAKLLFERIRATGTEVMLTREPGGETEVGDSIRNILLHKDHEMDAATEFLLFASDRNEHYKKVIRTNLEKGIIVISDRFTDSSVAYQGYGRGLDLNFINQVHNYITDGKKPDITFIVDVKPESGLKRLDRLDRIEKVGIEFLKKVREGYFEMAKKETRFHIVNGERDIEKIHEEIWEIYLIWRGKWIKGRE